jgi:hypothetical protein
MHAESRDGRAISAVEDIVSVFLELSIFWRKIGASTLYFRSREKKGPAREIKRR